MKYTIYIDTTERFRKKVILTKNMATNPKKRPITPFTERVATAEETDRIEGDTDIISSIELVLKRNELKLHDITEFVANPGPGSFTGIKIGITVANVLNWVLGKKFAEELQTPVYGKLPNIQ